MEIDVKSLVAVRERERESYSLNKKIGGEF